MCWDGFGESENDINQKRNIDCMFYERFRIKNFRGKFHIQIAHDWGGIGGPRAEDYTDIHNTAWPYLFKGKSNVKSWGPFEVESEAQVILKILKKQIKEYWIQVLQFAKEHSKQPHRNKIIQTLDAMQFAFDKEYAV